MKFKQSELERSFHAEFRKVENILILQFAQPSQSSGGLLKSVEVMISIMKQLIKLDPTN